MKTNFICFYFLLDPDEVSKSEHGYLHLCTEHMKCRIFHIEYPNEDHEYVIYAPRAERNYES